MIPSNDNHDSPWRGYRFTRTCDCGNQRFRIYLLDGAPRVACSVCEMDHTEAIWSNWAPRA